MTSPVTSDPSSGPDLSDSLEDEAEKRVSWVELFYDLVFVFAVTQVATMLAGDVSWRGLLESWTIFTPFWWAWVGTAVLSNLTDMDDVKARLRLFAIGLGTFLMTVGAPAAFDERGIFFAAAFVAVRLLIVWWFREQFGRFFPHPMTASAFVVAPLLLATAFLPHDAQRIAWAVLMVAELSTALVFQQRIKTNVTPNISHLPERFGLIIIIAVGESLVAVGAAVNNHFGAAEVTALAVCFALTCGLWWTYFHHGSSAVAHALRISETRHLIMRQVLAYGHYGLTCAIVAVAVGMKFVVKHPLAPLHAAEIWLLCGGAALYLAVFVYQRWRMFGKLAITRAPAALVCLAVGAVGGLLPAIALAALLALVFVGLALTEAAIIARNARRTGEATIS